MKTNKKIDKLNELLSQIRAGAFGGRYEFDPNYDELFHRLTRIEKLADTAMKIIADRKDTESE